MAGVAEDLRSHGATEAIGSNAVENGVHVADLQATIIRFPGNDHEHKHVTCRVTGLKFKPAGVDSAHVVKSLLI